MSYQEGYVIGGRYRIHNLIGAGGLSSTYLAVDMKLDERLVAIKTFPHVLEHQPSILKQENRLLADLHHPNILQVFDYIEDNSNIFLVTEYAPLGTLYRHYRRGARIPLKIVVSYVAQIASALQYLHDHGIIHRDVKPSNIFLSSEDKVLLGDFGIAISIRDSSSGNVAGTILYMAPEQIQGHAVYASDQYSLATVAYEWLAGTDPFSGTSEMDIIARKFNEQPSSLRSKNPAIPPDVDQVIRIALAKDPKDRFRSVQAFATALEEASQSGVPFPKSLTESFAPPAPSWYAGGMTGELVDLPPTPTTPPLQTAPGGRADTSANSSPAPITPSIDPTSPIARSSPPPESSRQIMRQSPERDQVPRAIGRGSSASPEPTELSLYAVARADIEENNRVIVGKMYVVQAGISQQAVEGFSGGPFVVSVPDPQQPLRFDILIHADGGVVLTRGWRYRLRYDPRDSKVQFITCTFQAREAGKGLLIISFYRERQWLQTIRLEVEGVEQLQTDSVRTVL
jgi:serine/threonine protein kinase